jgi:c(7)-type cytochrome triheme protein
VNRSVRHLALAICLTLTASAAIGEAVFGDIEFERKVKGSDDIPPAVFPHWVHRVKFKCFVCHNDSVGFKMQAGETPNVNMDAIEEGRYCGRCHKGKPAFAVNFETCNRCHRK